MYHQRHSLLRFDGFEVNLLTGEVRKADVRFPLQDQPLRILIRLLERPGELVTREELRRELWAADTFVDFEHGLNAAIRRLRDAIGDSAEVPRFIETVPKHGYRLIASVQAVHPPESPAGRPSVAVLPFINLSTELENEYFADGLTEDVIAQLSKIGGLKVIARASIMRFKTRGESLHEIAARLQVATVLDGSVRRAGDRVRIVAELADTESEQPLWSETYDRQLTDIFAVQSEVALRIASAVQACLSHGRAGADRGLP